MTPRLGIVGGMGAAAGLALAGRVVRISQGSGATQDQDFTNFVLYNLPASGMDALGMTNQDEVRDQLIDAMRLMTACNCAVVVIACNTVQIFHQELQQRFPATQLVNPIECACDKMLGVEKVGVLCSQTTKHLELYDQALARRGSKIIATTGVEQACVDEAVAAAICGKENPAHVTTLRNIMELMMGRGATRFIFGCTELPLIFHGSQQLPYDAVDAGAAAIDKAITLLPA